MPHPHRRTWTLGTLDRTAVYTLWFDAEAFRWEVAEGPERQAAAGDDRARAEYPPMADSGALRTPGASARHARTAGRRWYARG